MGEASLVAWASSGFESLTRHSNEDPDTVEKSTESGSSAFSTREGG